MFPDICSAFTINMSFTPTLNVEDTAWLQLKIIVLLTITLVLHRCVVTLNDITIRSPKNNEFTVQVHERPILFISTKTSDPDFTDPSQLLTVLKGAKN